MLSRVAASSSRAVARFLIMEDICLRKRMVEARRVSLLFIFLVFFRPQRLLLQATEAPGSRPGGGVVAEPPGECWRLSQFLD